MDRIAPSPVLADRLAGTRAREITIVLAGLISLICLNQISVPLWFTPVPLTFGTLAALVVGAATGPRRALGSTGLYLAGGVIGAPWFAGGKGGWQFASFGYLIGFMVAGVVVGMLAERGWTRSIPQTFCMFVIGSVVVYGAGLTWMVPFLGITVKQGITLGVEPFLIGDALKCAVAAGILPAVARLVDRPERI